MTDYTGSVGLDYKVAMEAAVRTAIAGADPGGRVLVEWGYPEPGSADDMILIMNLDGDQDIANLGTQRQREETMNLKVHFCSWRSDQRQADAAAWALLKLVTNQVRSITGDSTLGGVVRQCFLTGYSSQGFTYPDNTIRGRGCEVIANFTAMARITS